jgi:hypothetical protein
MLTIHRRNPARNEARFYAMALQADLLAGWTVVREWGRIGGAQAGSAPTCMATWRRQGLLRKGGRRGSGGGGIGEERRAPS